jgi:hypothetical protein
LVAHSQLAYNLLIVVVACSVDNNFGLCCLSYSTLLLLLFLVVVVVVALCSVVNRFPAIRYLLVFFTSKKHALIFILKL